MKRDLVYTTGELPTRPFDATRFLAPSPHQNRRRRARVEKVGLAPLQLGNAACRQWFSASGVGPHDSQQHVLHGVVLARRDVRVATTRWRRWALRQTGSDSANVDGADDRIAAEPLTNQLHEVCTRQFGIQASAHHGIERIATLFQRSLQRLSRCHVVLIRHGHLLLNRRSYRSRLRRSKNNRRNSPARGAPQCVRACARRSR
jgi:hypothetical protein